MTGAPATPRIPRTPRTLDLESAANCNLRCSYCYFFDNSAVGYSNLPADEGLTFFEEPGSLGVMDVFLTGDEPFTRPGLPSLVQGLVRNRLRFGFASNGTSIDDAVAAGIASTGCCNYVQVSVDGSCPETHDAARGAGSFDGAIRATGSRSRRAPRSIATTSTTWRTPLACCWRTWG